MKMALINPNLDSEIFWQHIIALDVQFNSSRNFGSYLKTLYIKRRNQLFRELSKQQLNTFRKQYLKLRHLILSKKYHINNNNDNNDTCFISLNDQTTKQKSNHNRNPSDSSFLSFIYDDLASSDIIKREPNQNLTANDLLYNEQITRYVSCTNSIAFCENFSFSGVHHIFDQHKDSVNCIKFANKDKSLICFASNDHTLSICQLTPLPATILFVLRGHHGPVTSFEWSQSNDLIVSCSLDSTLNLWSTTNGNCLRTFKDPEKASLLTCVFHPNNNNMIFTGNSLGIVNILNLSTGIYSKNSVTICDGHINSMCFQCQGQLLWVGDYKGFISTFRFEMEHCKLSLINKVIIVPGCPITSLSTLYQNNEDLLLANCACNAVVLFKSVRNKPDKQLEFLKCFPIKHQNSSLKIKSSFCPNNNSTSNNLGICILTGSEDTCIYFYMFDGKNKKSRCVNKLQGHSSPILDVCFNHDESLLASADTKGNIIIWKRESIRL